MTFQFYIGGPLPGHGETKEVLKEADTTYESLQTQGKVGGEEPDRERRRKEGEKRVDERG